MNIALLLGEGRSGGQDAATRVIKALSEGAYNVKSDRAVPPTDLIRAADALAAKLRDERAASDESMRLMVQLFNECGLALVVTDAFGIIVHANEAAGHLFRRPTDRLAGQHVGVLGLDSALAMPSGSIISSSAGYRSSIRMSKASLVLAGQGLNFFVFDGVDELLHINERVAFDKLIRVLAHEINNSVAPIVSLSETLMATGKRDVASGPAELSREVLERGLAIIRRRALAIGAIFDRYTRRRQKDTAHVRMIDVAEVVKAVAEALVYVTEVRCDGTHFRAMAEPSQLEQVLINLAKNGHEASGRGVRIELGSAGVDTVIKVVDDGPGLPASDSLFVPFFTTKDSGSGLGLSVSREIIAGFGGQLTLQRDRRLAETVAVIVLAGNAPSAGTAEQGRCNDNELD